MSNIFQSVVSSKKKYNNFPLGREVLVSGRLGKLIPVQCDEVVPGDRFKQNIAFLCRFAPLSAPAMVRFNVHFHTFYVPYRIITPETSRESTYERFIKSIGKSKEDVPVLPYFHGYCDAGEEEFQYFDIGSLYDYLGYPVPEIDELFIPEEARITLMPFLSYQRIYQDFYRRDQVEVETVYPSNVESVSLRASNLTVSTKDSDYGELADNQRMAKVKDLFTLQTRNYERDYFTSALPEPQFGDEVSIGDGNINWIGGNSPLSFTGAVNPVSSEIFINGDSDKYSLSVGNDLQLGWPEYNDRLDLYASLYDNETSRNVSIHKWNIQPDVIRGTVTSAFGENLAQNLQGGNITINEFRLAMQLQGIKEQINRVGTRYLEIMEGIYGVRVPDARLQRPIFLGGFKTSVTVGSVMQTSESNNTPQGTLTGQMSSTGTSQTVSPGYEFKEHGYLMTVMSITPRTSYFGGMPRKYMKKYPEDFYLPQFDHLGEQEITTNELVWDGESYEENVFGYTPRYSEYKSALSTVHGEFRKTLANWHVARSFDSIPALNPDFIHAEPEDFDRIFAFENVEGTSNEHFYCQIYIDQVGKRNMSKYSTPYTLY